LEILQEEIYSSVRDLLETEEQWALDMFRFHPGGSKK
jgi:hypothetical protein